MGLIKGNTARKIAIIILYPLEILGRNTPEKKI